ncbi:MAG: major capsid protein [Microviridae sp.]|nr:MAG: major capsid protein [Microviridae sp.]
MALKGNAFGAVTRTRTTPVPVQRTNRAMEQRILTSLPAGKMVPLMVLPLLREDSIATAAYRLSFEMQETVEVLMNAVNVRVMAYLVPNLAFDRFPGLDVLNRSYEGQPTSTADPTIVPWFETIAGPAHGVNQILTKMGKHFREGQMINTAYVEAYNQIWNFRAKNRSPDITLRTRLDDTLAPAFWQHQTFAHIVPDFDQAVIDGEVALNVTNAKMPVLGMGAFSVSLAPGSLTLRESGDKDTAYPRAYQVASSQETASAGQSALGFKAGATDGYPDVWAELQDNGITVSLSNIEMARKTQAFAQLRRQYHGHSDEYIIDLLMDGISIPDEAWKQPMLLADDSTVFGMSKRYASDGASLTESVVNGVTFIDVRFSVPRCPTGGVVMMVAEIAPEQLFERQMDPYLHAKTVDDLPQFLRDTLDPEKVSVVPNEYVDIDHTVPGGVFGYAPLNHQWAKSIPQIGGRFYRPEVDAAFDEDRQRIWAVETVDPVLSEDFYLVTSMHYKPFVVTDLNVDPFDCLVRGTANIRGNTVFGGLLVEASSDYAEVVEEQPTDRIEKPVTAEAEGEGE